MLFHVLHCECDFGFDDGEEKKYYVVFHSQKLSSLLLPFSVNHNIRILQDYIGEI